MITSSSISYVSQMLDEPQNINNADAESIRELIETYPYFVPARYMQAAQQHKLEPFNAETMSAMQLFSGNWLLYSEYLQTALGDEAAEYVAPATAEPRKKPRVQEEIDDELPAEEEDSAEVEQPGSPVEETIQITEPVADIQQEEAEAQHDIVVEATAEEIAPEQEPEPLHEEFVPENTGFIRGKNIPPVQGKTNQPEQPKQGIPESAKRAAAWEDKGENLIPPVYTEDYFLHQGMHVSNDIPSELGPSERKDDTDSKEKSLMVVMSFSEWLTFYKKKKQQEQEEVKDQKELKTMWQKEKLAAALEEENEEIPENVFEMAVNSITKEENLVSESLAEVMVKQGRYDRAIEMYKKLSLRKPQKKAYFARKIEEILKEK